MKNGASEGIRTLDTHVGNVMLYQAELRSLPFKKQNDNAILTDCNTKNIKKWPASRRQAAAGIRAPAFRRLTTRPIMQRRPASNPPYKPV